MVPEIEDDEWLRFACENDVFDFLDREAEDIYTLADGVPVCPE